LGQTEFLSDRQLTLKKVGEGRYELVQARASGHEARPPMEMDTELLAEMMKGFRAELRVEVPGARRGIQCRRTGAVRRPPGFLMWTAMPVRCSARSGLAMRVVFERPGLGVAGLRQPG
jgi:hypothetical protein